MESQITRELHVAQRHKSESDLKLSIVNHPDQQLAARPGWKPRLTVARISREQRERTREAETINCWPTYVTEAQQDGSNAHTQ